MMSIRGIEVRLESLDFKKSVAFYRDLLGFSVSSVFPATNPGFAILRRDGACLQISGRSHVEPLPQPSCTLWIDVDGVLDWHAALKDRVSIEWGPEVYFYGRREFAFRDPDGHLVILSEATADPVTCPD